MPQNLEHAQKLAPSPDLTWPFFYLPKVAQRMHHKLCKISARFAQRFSGHFRKKKRREEDATTPHPLVRLRVKCHFRWKVIVQKVIKWSLVQWSNVSRELPPIRVSVLNHLNRADSNSSDLSLMSPSPI